MIIREWCGAGQYDEIEIIITATRKGWQAYATGAYQPMDDDWPRIPIDAILEVTSRSEAHVMNALEGAIRGNETALNQIVQWAITACMVREGGNADA